ncbi:sporulation integral membrane protein YlbJ [Clostridium sardiniense]|uniref:sporulation integral membrane protein YlbJ n=1 Tax=Clostridium sardiniense TaxID=29369 RepID=UPI0019563EDB|nr:sporulation integral membrane protein YlbJ [Clostridium sardiniense]MBM7835128.1 sporulation integral membrane protein YlbJ [Clostridium sardiniense]
MNSIFILWIFIFIFTFILLKLTNIKKNYIFCFVITVLIVLFVVNIEASIQAAIDGCKLSFKAIVPTVFSFSLICNLLISYDGISLYSNILGPLMCRPLKLSPSCSFPIVASMLCGYPLGAKYSSDIYELGYIEKKEYFRLVNIASNTGPIFLLGSVGATLLGNPKYGYFLLISNYLSLFFIALLTIKKSSSNNNYKKKISKSSNVNFGLAIDEAIKNAINTTLAVSGYVVAFSVIISILKNNSLISSTFYNIETFLNIPKNALYGTFLGSIEMTNGCNIIASSNLSIHLKLSIISFFASFSGLSAIAQTSSFMSKNNVSMIKYMFLKLVQGLFSFTVSFCLSNIIFKTTETSSLITSTNSYKNLFMYAVPILIFLSIPLILKSLRKILVHIS